MSARNSSDNFRTWVEIDARAARHNYHTFRSLLSKKTQLWPVVKSNAYGHGLVLFSKFLSACGAHGFCVDSLVEGIRLRKEGIQKSIFVLGPTLHSLLAEAEKKGIEVSVSSIEALRMLAVLKTPPRFHLKIDTGMHRQGFFLKDLASVTKEIRRRGLIDRCRGIFTHFASAKDINYPSYTEMQFAQFQKAIRVAERELKKRLFRHCAATGGTLLNKKYHLDMVRVGIGMYGLYPSRELEIQLPRVRLEPVLSWRSVVMETKKLAPGDYVGYDLVERVTRPTTVAVLPLGYWHGLPRALSGTGEVLVRGRRARILGRISMDLTVLDATSAKPRVGEVATLIGRDGKEEVLAFDFAGRAGTVHYEIVTRLNPLIERILVHG